MGCTPGCVPLGCVQAKGINMATATAERPQSVTREDLLDAAWESFQAAKRAMLSRTACDAAHRNFQAARDRHSVDVTNHTKAALRVKDIEDQLVAQGVTA